MSASSSFRLHRVVRVAAAIVVMAAVAVWWPTPRGGAQDAAPPFELTGAGASEVQPLISTLATPLFEARRPLSLSYFARGDRDGLATLARGSASYAISGRPLNHEDRDALEARDVGVIQAPFSLTSMAFLLSAPWAARGGDPSNPNPIQFTSFDPADPEAPVVTENVPGPLMLGNSIIASLYLNGNGPYGAEMSAIYAPKNLINPGVSATRVARSDAGAMNYHLQEFLQHSNRAWWDARAAVEGVVATEPSESWPFLNSVPTRAGDGQIGTSVGDWLNPDGGNASGGTLAPVSSATAKLEFGTQIRRKANGEPYTPLYLVGVQNGAGEVISPTPENMTRAAELGQGKALYGLTENVPGAYPLTWVTDIYVPDRGLSADETTGVATLMRVQATAGQVVGVNLGEGLLPRSHIEELLDAADEVVERNCSGSGKRLRTVADGGQFWPTSIPVPGSYTICEGVAAPTTTVTGGSSTDVSAGSTGNSTGNSSAGSGSSSPSYSSGSSGALSSDGSAYVFDEFVDAGDVGAAASSSGEGSSDGESEEFAAVAAELPLSPPSDGRFVLDRLATMLLGGAAFLLLRRIIGPRLAT
jgi:hypothetical protein